jgi:hypothetical protein
MGLLNRFKGLSDRLKSISCEIFIFSVVCMTLALFVSLVSLKAGWLLFFIGLASALGCVFLLN